MKLTKEQLVRLLDIAEENTMECYREHCLNYGQPDDQRACNRAETEMYQDDLSFIVEIKEQEGIKL